MKKEPAAAVTAAKKPSSAPPVTVKAATSNNGWLWLAVSLAVAGLTVYLSQSGQHLSTVPGSVNSDAKLGLKGPQPLEESPFYGFHVRDLRHQPFDLHRLKGKVVLVVNVASQCGFTNQYGGLQTLYETYRERGLEILGFPCNQFAGQEPGDEKEIEEFARAMGAQFPLFEKVNVNGEDAHPLYQWLKSEKSNLMMNIVKWNFEGRVVARFASTTAPEALEATIVEELDKLE